MKTHAWVGEDEWAIAIQGYSLLNLCAIRSSETHHMDSMPVFLGENDLSPKNTKILPPHYRKHVRKLFPTPNLPATPGIPVAEHSVNWLLLWWI